MGLWAAELWDEEGAVAGTAWWQQGVKLFGMAVGWHGGGTAAILVLSAVHEWTGQRAPFQCHSPQNDSSSG